jgi:glutamine amidotransferase
VSVTIVDYGLGNLLSVARGFERAGADVLVTSSPEDVRRATRVVLPGVGAFADGMAGLSDRGLVEPLVEHARAGKPLLGICLGMHLLMETSEEFGRNSGLGIVAGRTVALAPADGDKVPNIGWRPLVPAGEWDGTVLDSLAPAAEAYFVHSFVAEPADPAARLADAEHGGRPFTAVLRVDNVAGTQFHPEKSGPVGLRILANFLGA